MDSEKQSQQSEQTPSPMTVVKGGETFTVELINGVEHDVFVRLVPIRQMGDYLSHYDDMPALIAFVIGEKVEELDKIAEDSLYALGERVRAINDPRFNRWYAERMATMKKFSVLSKKINGV